MTLLPLEIRVNMEGAVLFLSRKTDSAFLSLQKKTWVRDNYTCQYCGFRAEEHQEVVNKNGDYRDNKSNNLVTACVFCAHTQLLGLKNNSKIIYLPDISQADLNQFIRILFCASYYGEQYEDTAKTLVQALKHRANTVETVFGTDSSDSVLFAQTYIDAIDFEQKVAERKEIMAQLRWLPSKADYEEIITYWAEHIITRDIIEQRIAKEWP